VTGRVAAKKKARHQAKTGDLPLGDLAQQLLHQAHRGGHRLEFLQDVSAMILELSGCDALEIRLSDREVRYRWRTCGPAETSEYSVLEYPAGTHRRAGAADGGLEKLCDSVLSGRIDRRSSRTTPHGSFWSGDTARHLGWLRTSRLARALPVSDPALDFPSLAVIPFAVEAELLGLLLLQSRRRNFVTRSRMGEFEAMATYLGLAVATRRAHAALRERVKELTCLYGLALLTDRSDLTQAAFLEQAVELLPPAWQYPDRAAAQISYDESVFRTRTFGEAVHTLTAPIRIDGQDRGEVEVRYLLPTPDAGPRPFLVEERHLLDAVATHLSHDLQRRFIGRKRLQLETQLRHADRLATIGQLAAGVAHEINEPLANILGLAQLITREPDTSGATREDIKKIIDASLHAREIIRSLMLFARQTPPQKVFSDLNQLVEESLTLVEARCAKSGVKLELELADDLPHIEVDPVQIRQVVVNLAVNAVQAMSGGGTLTVTTRPQGARVVLCVQDTGTGMTEHVKRKLFMPFFTTKAQEGTGLGLSVSHGIVTAHGGDIQVESSPGHGATFEVQLPVRAAAGLAEEGDLESA